MSGARSHEPWPDSAHDPLIVFLEFNRGATLGGGDLASPVQKRFEAAG